MCWKPTRIHRFIGCVGYYRHFIENFAKIAHLLFQLLTKDDELLCTEYCEASFKKIKGLTCKAPILRGPHWVLPFHIDVDASQTTLGAILGQHVDKTPYEIYYVSNNLILVELNYIVTEKKFMASIYDINKFRHYITGYPTFLHTDHASIRHLMNKIITPSRITRWCLLLQEFDIIIIDKPGKDNVVVDFLSRMDNNDKCTSIEDSFPDEHLFAVSTKPLWYVDIAKNIATGKVPHHFSYR